MGAFPAEWGWRASATSPPNGLVSARCLGWPHRNLQSNRVSACATVFVPGNGIARPETTRPKPPGVRDWSLSRPERGRRSPPIRGYSAAARKSPLAPECLVDLRGLELRARHAVLSNLQIVAKLHPS